MVDKCGSGVQDVMVRDQLDVARLKLGIQAEFIALGQLVEERHGCIVVRRQPRNFLVPLGQDVVVVRVVHAQVALRQVKQKRLSATKQCTKKGRG